MPYFNAVTGTWMDDNTDAPPDNNNNEDITPSSGKPWYDVLIGLGTTAANIISTTHGNPANQPQQPAQQPEQLQQQNNNNNNGGGDGGKKPTTGMSTATKIFIVVLILIVLGVAGFLILKNEK